MKKVARTEAAEQPDPTALSIGDPVWLFEFEHGRRREHVARVDKVHADGTIDLSFQIVGEIGRNKMQNVPGLRSDTQGSAWMRAK
ncbi:MAG: hypothetical protein H0X39_00900 [Actinobacteria bacterium]|nr:hypothetical protein [Actinomycetota bacterium]